MKNGPVYLLLFGLFCLFESACAQRHVLDSGWHHVRNNDPREWSSFPSEEPARKYRLTFFAVPDSLDHTLRIRQADVKGNWRVTLNGHRIGSLVADEKVLEALFALPPGVIAKENLLEIACEDKAGDDIRIGHVVLHPRAKDALLSETTLSIIVADAGTRQPLPARLTFSNGEGILQPVTASAAEPVAIRAGYVYTGTGKVVVSLPSGKYVIYATRGFEYGVDSLQVDLTSASYRHHTFYIKKEVSTDGWISTDTHIHTLTWSGHGDATTRERVITIAGEGIEMPVLTDHNLHADMKPFTLDVKASPYFTPVVGNEVTTPVGHFNIFPLSPVEKPADHRVDNWAALSAKLKSNGGRVIILNHGRDIHMGFRPFDPRLHHSAAGLRFDHQAPFFNAMEVINSGSQQTDQQQLVRDWFGWLNHGVYLTPVGASDSHDVSRYFVGQARTYIRAMDEDPSRMDTNAVIGNFLAGNVMVSFGLLSKLEVNDAYGPGELAPASDPLKVVVEVLGPSWSRAEKISLYANGRKIREATRAEKTSDSWQETWYLNSGVQDFYLVAVAEGPDGEKPFWPIAKPYQPAGPDWHPKTLSLSGAVWIDADKNGRRNSARDYALLIYDHAAGDTKNIIRMLRDYDEAVAVQAAALLYEKGSDPFAEELTNALRRAAPHVQAGFKLFSDQLERPGEH